MRTCVAQLREDGGHADEVGVGTKRIKPRTSTFPSSLVKKMRLRLVFTFCGQGALR